MPAMKCINEEICSLDIAISSVFPALKTTILTTLSTNSSYEHYSSKFNGKTCRFSAAQCFLKRIIIIQLCVCSKCKQTGARAIIMTSKEVYTVDDALCMNWG